MGSGRMAIDAAESSVTRRWVRPCVVASGCALGTGGRTAARGGLPAAGSVQHALHGLTGSEQPQGWSHQVSAGGEPTLRYSTARQALIEHESGYDTRRLKRSNSSPARDGASTCARAASAA